MTLSSKFKKDIQTLRSAANGDIYLDVKNPKLFKKVAATTKMKEWCFLVNHWMIMKC